MDFSDSYFPMFVLKIKIDIVNLCIQSKYEKIRTRTNCVFGQFSHSVTDSYA